MGVDIHVAVKRDGKFIDLETDGYRNSDFFRGLYNNLYDLPKVYGERLDEYINQYKEFYYGHFSMDYEKFVEWYELNKPYLMAGWVHRYDIWLYENKNVEIIDYECYPERLTPDMVFYEWEDKYCPFIWLFNLLKENCDENSEIYICFDC